MDLLVPFDLHREVWSWTDHVSFGGLMSGSCGLHRGRVAARQVIDETESVGFALF